MPAVARLLVKTWLITCPESALKPVTVPDVSVAVQWKLAPGGIEVNEMFVDSPEQIDFDNGLFVTTGGVVRLTRTVSTPMQPFAFVTVTR